MNNCDIALSAMLCFTCVFIFTAFFYSIYMIYSVKALKEKGLLDKDVIKSEYKTYQFAFLAIIIIVLMYLSFGLKENIPDGILALIGTLAGYVLGGQRNQESNYIQKSNDELQ